MNNFTELWNQLVPLYNETEAKALVRTVLEVRYGLSLTDILCGKVNELSAEDQLGLHKIVSKLAQAEPVQYILGSTEFAGRTFHVSSAVLIPRVETQELCQWVVEDCEQNQQADPSILDVGTGSGAIAITLALDILQADVEAWDISADALDIARQNAIALGATVRVVNQDILNAPNDTHKWDIIVSNPPYIHPKEAEKIERNVLDYEPSLALFTPSDRPLLFYEAITQYANKALRPGGLLYFEMNPQYVEELKNMLQQEGFIRVEVKNDSFGKQRMMKAIMKRHPFES